MAVWPNVIFLAEWRRHVAAGVRTAVWTSWCCSCESMHENSTGQLTVAVPNWYTNFAGSMTAGRMKHFKCVREAWSAKSRSADRKICKNSNTPLSFLNRLPVFAEIEIWKVWNSLILCLSGLWPNKKQPDALRNLKQCACIATDFWMRLKFSF